MNHFNPEFNSKSRDQTNLETTATIHFRQPIHLRGGNIQAQNQDQCQTFISQGPPPPPPYTGRMDPNQPSIMTSLLPHPLGDEQQFGTSVARHYSIPLQHQDPRHRQVLPHDRQELGNHFGQMDATFPPNVHHGMVDSNAGNSIYAPPPQLRPGVGTNEILNVTALIYPNRDDQQISYNSNNSPLYGIIDANENGNRLGRTKNFSNKCGNVKYTPYKNDLTTVEILINCETQRRDIVMFIYNRPNDRFTYRYIVPISI
ncbi:uncharacterized protein TRIADDRAFT_58292 [Trichoplax adhaerens]|uniref:Uncharacterized protein n=1 Tax=Trichoplax adhaerens TaxID=10228 RepID=B3S1H4_TRIAD|nr:predicted protein [Trichoplax adhaerens]EDV23226.1 predicted protein [Trichoplax adhaerens]|eukprot:XP_002114136.1 predicted protein [Trichoplax adhaerens]